MALRALTETVNLHARKKFRLAGGALLVVVALILGYYFHIDWKGRPVCHRAVEGALDQWMFEKGMNPNSRTNSFPNADGVSRESLESIGEWMGRGSNWAKGYRYMPGLRQNDPGHLVLMYVDRPTRWTWHAEPPTTFKDKAWIIVSVDFGGLRGEGELSERVTGDEFKRRIKETLEFLHTNSRPHWETVVKEHTRFLESLEHDKN